jgi:FMN reductase
MSVPVRILGIGGSVRAQSVNRRMLAMMLTMADELGAETVMADLHSMRLPIFDQETPREQQPQKLHWLIQQMQWADGFIVCSPTYLGSLSGALKNTLDSLHLAHGEPRVYFEDRPVVLGSFGYYGQDHTISSLAFVTGVMGAQVLPEHVIITAQEGDDTAVANDDAQLRMRDAVAALIGTVEKMRETSSPLAR